MIETQADGTNVVRFEISLGSTIREKSYPDSVGYVCKLIHSENELMHQGSVFISNATLTKG